MSENNANTETNKILFLNLVTMLSMSAMQQLGKIINPVAGKAEINLEAAQATIDTLDMLSAKTEGQLDKDEARFLKDTLAALKMNYVETTEMQKASPAAETAMGDKEGKGQKAPSEEPKDAASGPKSDTEQDKNPKFHKSYS